MKCPTQCASGLVIFPERTFSHYPLTANLNHYFSPGSVGLASFVSFRDLFEWVLAIEGYFDFALLAELTQSFETSPIGLN